MEAGGAPADLAVVACHQREALGRFAAPAADGKQVLDEKLLQRFKDFLFGLPSGPHATGDGGVSPTTSLAYCKAVDPAREALWKE